MRLVLALLLGTLLSQGAMAEVPPQRLATLSRGVNLIDVFSDKSVAAMRDEIAAVKRAGFRHVRFFIDPAWIWRSGEPQRLDQIIDAALAAKLGVIICMQSYGKDLRDNQSQIDAWGRAWVTLAKHYANTNPDLLFFELVNEPTFDDTQRWVDVQESLRRQVRAVAPHHTLLLTGSPTSTSAALSQLPPSQDDDVAYVFHIYAPMVFTHQGADWADPAFGTIHGLQYPPNPTNLAIIEHSAAPKLRDQIADYGRVGSNIILRDIEPAVSWAREHHAHLVVTEFGVYRPVAPPASRAAWLHDARTALEKFGIGWTVWEYNGGFGVKPELDIGCGPLPQALGLCS